MYRLSLLNNSFTFYSCFSFNLKNIISIIIMYIYLVDNAQQYLVVKTSKTTLKRSRKVFSSNKPYLWHDWGAIFILVVIVSVWVPRSLPVANMSLGLEKKGIVDPGCAARSILAVLQGENFTEMQKQFIIITVKSTYLPSYWICKKTHFVLWSEV